MATLVTLLDVEAEVEAVFVSFLSASPYSLARVSGSDSAAALNTPRVEVSVEVLKWGPHQHTVASGTYSGRALYDQFQLRLSIAVVYQPEHAQSPGTLRGTLRKAFTDWAGLKAAFASRAYLLPAPDSMRQIDGSRVIIDEERTERLESVWELVAFLNPVALAAAS